MTALTAPQLATYRTHPQFGEPYLWIDSPPVVFAAQADIPSGLLWPITSIVTKNPSGVFADIEPGMLVCFGSAAGLSDLGRTIVKGTSGGAILTLPRTSQGTVDGCINPANNSYLSVYDTFPPFAYHPYIDANGVTFKFSDWDFATYGANRLPICNIGAGCVYADNVDGSDIITLSLDATPSFGPGGAAISAYLWTVKDGTITVGTTTTAAITVTFPVGRRWIKCRVTDANGKQQTRRLLVVACKDGTAYEAITKFRPGPLRQTIEGQTIDFDLLQDVAESTYLDGSAIGYFVRERYGDSESSLTTSVVKFSGWLHTGSSSSAWQQTHLEAKTSLTCLDTAQKLATLPAMPQIIESAGSPTLWEQDSAPNIDKYLAYLWLYHSSGPALADFAWSTKGSTYPFVRLGSNGGNLYEQIDGRAKAIGYRLLSDAQGRLKVKVDPMLQDSGDRSSTVTIALTEDDWISLGWTDQRPPRSHWLDGSAIVASASAIAPAFCEAPGLTPSQGGTQDAIGEMLVATPTELTHRVGHAYQRANAPRGYFKIRLLHGGDAGYEPLDWVTLTMTSETAARRGLTFTERRFMIVEVETNFDNQTGQQTKDLTLEEETVGTPAALIIPPGSDITYTEPSEVFVADQSVDVTPALTGYPTRLLMYGTGGEVYRAINVDVVSGVVTPTWTSLGTNAGSPYSMTQDPWNYNNYYFLASGGVYKCTDVWGGAPALTTAATLAATGAMDAFSISNIVGSINRKGYFCWLGVKGGTMYFCYTTDYFATKSAVSLSVGTSHCMNAIALNCFNTGVVYVTAGQYLFKSTNWGASFSNVRAVGQDAGLAYVVYAKPGGADDTYDAYALYVLRTAGPHFPLYKIEANTLIANVGDSPSTDTTQGYFFPNINALTIDSNYMVITSMYTSTIYLTENFWASNTTITAPAYVQHASYGGVRGVNGCPNNPNWLLAWGSGLGVTFDRGATWYNLSAPVVPVSAVGDLGQLYAVPMR